MSRFSITCHQRIIERTAWEGYYTNKGTGFSPYNIQNMGGELCVTFAENRSDGRETSYGEGAGYTDIFDAEGNLVLRLEHGPWMNAPWAAALAPVGFEKPGGRVLLGNTGSGKISIFDPMTGS